MASLHLQLELGLYPNRDPQPKQVKLSEASNLIDVVRTLEMEELEQRCWDQLIEIVDQRNCKELHMLADEKGCDALKEVVLTMGRTRGRGCVCGRGLASA